MAVEGSGSMLPWKIFENLHTAVAILLLFEQFFGKFCFKFFASKLKFFTKYDAFYLYIFDYACLGRKSYCCRKGLKVWKSCDHQKHV